MRIGKLKNVEFVLACVLVKLKRTAGNGRAVGQRRGVVGAYDLRINGVGVIEYMLVRHLYDVDVFVGLDNTCHLVVDGVGFALIGVFDVARAGEAGDPAHGVAVAHLKYGGGCSEVVRGRRATRGDAVGCGIEGGRLNGREIQNADEHRTEHHKGKQS